VRGFSPQINILLTCLAAAGIVPVLGLPWFGNAIDSNDGYQGSIELMGEAIARWFGETGVTSSGTAVLGTAEIALLALCGLTALLALLMLVPMMRSSLRGVLKMLPAAAPLVVVVGIISEAHRAEVEPRWGAFAALALSLLMATAAAQAAEMRERKTAPKVFSAGRISS
jgi:hypothetical protein